jgi:hypothetical protein
MHAACDAAAAADEVPAKPPHAAAAAGVSGEQRNAAGRKQQLMMLSRYPSAPDPQLLMALSPVHPAHKNAFAHMRGVPVFTGTPRVAAAPPLDKGIHGMRGMWLKVRHSARNVASADSAEVAAWAFTCLMTACCCAPCVRAAVQPTLMDTLMKGLT